ncbi:HlyD family efflux transporter periplasmic adaptor subunit [Pelomonas sp. KK5]|uniref:HlyD family secretion protein n=1 Tax=Pelomonas sp. KK5 TaxID=1855730 RepID=UPI00097C510A|nr:HlyD family efflux transporter periplasmic adaptor subunit [Pelomonas sp. KK5]
MSDTDNNKPAAAASNAPATVTPVSIPPSSSSRRKTALTALTVAVVLALGGYAIYEYVIGKRTEATDNAYVNANVVQITPLVGGTVKAIRADDTDYVKAGQPLVSLDPADARVALDQASSQLAQTVREVRTLYTNNGSFESQVQAREADVRRAQTELDRASADVTRRQPLLASGAVGKEEVDHAVAQATSAKSALAAAQSALQTAREQLGSNKVLTEGTDVANHPNVQRAAARMREAYLALQRTELQSPVDGWVARRSVQLGQRVAAGAPLMSVVGLRNVWVDANFKESQVAKLRIGQVAKLTADVYGDKVEYTGHIVGLSAGTGAAFSLLPAQNATGNWIKVVQRLPVRIALDPKQVSEHPLRVGLSMDVAVDVQDKSGKMLTEAPNTAPAAQTEVFDNADKGADDAVNKVIRANLGSAGGKKAVR